MVDEGGGGGREGRREGLTKDSAMIVLRPAAMVPGRFGKRDARGCSCVEAVSLVFEWG